MLRHERRLAAAADLQRPRVPDPRGRRLDSLRAVANPGDVPFTAAVPGLDLQADGYFMNPQPP